LINLNLETAACLINQHLVQHMAGGRWLCWRNCNAWPMFDSDVLDSW